MKKEHYTLRLSSDFKSLEGLNNFISRIGDEHKVPQDILSRVKLSLEELAVNIISYGYEGKKSHSFELRVSFNKNQMIFFLQSGGKPFNPLTFKPLEKAKNIESAPVGGFGILLAKTFMDNMTYTYAEGLNQLTLTKTFFRREPAF